MQKEIREAGEKLTGFKKTTDNIKEANIFAKTISGDVLGLGVYKSGKIKYTNLNGKGKGIPQKGHKGIYEIGMGNIFWEDEFQTSCFHDYLNDRKSLLEEYLKELKEDFNSPLELQRNSTKDEMDVVEGILKYKFGGDDA